MSERTLGVDIGLHGALALFDGSDLVEIVDMPCLKDGPARRRSINAPLLAEIVFKSHATKAYVEHVGARPMEGAVGAFAFGRSRGVIEGVMAAAGLSVRFLTPPAWKRLVGLPPGKDKDASRSEAIRRFPSHASWFALKSHEGRADSVLIGVAGLLKEATAP